MCLAGGSIAIFKTKHNALLQHLDDVILIGIDAQIGSDGQRLFDDFQASFHIVDRIRLVRFVFERYRSIGRELSRLERGEQTGNIQVGFAEHNIV